MDLHIRSNPNRSNPPSDHEADPSQGQARLQTQPACIACCRRKIRCDKHQPCASCARIGHSCVYPEKRQKREKRRPAQKPALSNVADRITTLEKTIQSMIESKRASSSSASCAQGCDPEMLVTEGSSSQYYNDVLLSRMIDQSLLPPPTDGHHSTEKNILLGPIGVLSTPSRDEHLSSFHPPKRVALRLWKTFLDRIDPCYKIIHVPTDEIDIFAAINDPSDASIQTLALCFAIYYASVVVLDDCDAGTLFQGNKILALHQFKLGLEQALAYAQFLEHPTVRLLQALAIYLVVLPVHHGGRSNWILNGLALRSAQSIGLHRDGTKLGLGHFDSEIRRRVWWHLLGKDGRATEDYGLNTIDTDIPCSISLPRNIDDTDLSPEMEHLPPARAAWTSMTFSLIRIEFSRAWHRLMKTAASSQPPLEEARVEILRKMRSRLTEHLRYCNPIIPHQRLALHISTFVSRKLDFVTRQQWFILHHPDVREPRITDADLLEALDILQLGSALAVEEDFYSYRWVAWPYPQYHVLLYVLSYLCTQPEGPMVDTAWASVEMQFDCAKFYGPTLNWKLLGVLRSKAKSLRQLNTGPAQGSDKLASADWENSPEEESKWQLQPIASTGISSSVSSEADFNESFDGLDWTSMFALQDSRFDGMDLTTL